MSYLLPLTYELARNVATCSINRLCLGSLA